MQEFFDFLVKAVSQFAGGTGSLENNLVRFGLTGVLWGSLFFIALARLRDSGYPREKMLLWGFGLGSVSAFILAGFASFQMLGWINREEAFQYLVPIERALSLASIVVVAGAFIRYILDEPRLARNYTWLGISIASLSLIIAFWQWPRYLEVMSEAAFLQTWSAWLFIIPSSAFLLTAIVILQRKKDWLSTLVTVALLFFLIGDVLDMINYATGKAYNSSLCPFGNSLRILAIPLLAYVYLREQTLEKKQVEKDLAAYRLHLEELVEQRTTEISGVNYSLKQEIEERKQAEAALAALKERYELILESAGEGIFGLNRQGRFIFVNPAAAEMLGYAIEELIGQASHPLLHRCRMDGSAYPEEECPLYAGFMKGIASQGEEEYFWRKDNRNFPVRYLSNLMHKDGDFTGIVVVFRDITYQKKAEAETAQRNSDLAAQNKISTILGQSLNLDNILDSVLDEVLSVVQVDVGLVFLEDPSSRDLKKQACRGILSEVEETQCEQNWNCCLEISRQAMNRLQTVVMPVDEFLSKYPQRQPIVIDLKTYLSVPLVSKGVALGALTLGSRQPEPVKTSTLALLTIIGQQIGMAIENAYLYQQAEQVAALEERQKIAADMHDSLAQTISLLGLQVDDANALLRENSYQKAEAELGEIRGLIERVSIDVRRSISNLQGTSLAQKSIQELLNELPGRLLVDQSQAVHLDLKISEPLFLTADNTNQLALILQEALLNAHRHAKAQQISLVLEPVAGQVRILVVDDGVGFDPNEEQNKRPDHFGLGILRARATRMGADLQIESAPGAGTRIHILFPWP